MILEYNCTNGGADNADKLVREYSCVIRTSRGPFFMYMLDIGAGYNQNLDIEKQRLELPPEKWEISIINGLKQGTHKTQRSA